MSGAVSGIVGFGTVRLFQNGERTVDTRLDEAGPIAYTSALQLLYFLLRFAGQPSSRNVLVVRIGCFEAMDLWLAQPHQARMSF